MYASETTSTDVTVSRCFRTSMQIWYYVLTLRNPLKLLQDDEVLDVYGTVEITSNLSLNLSESVRRTVLGQYVELSA